LVIKYRNIPVKESINPLMDKAERFLKHETPALKETYVSQHKIVYEALTRMVEGFDDF